MSKIFELNDITLSSFIHGTIERFSYDGQNKSFQLVYSYLNLEAGGCLYGCTITITDWNSLEVIEQGSKVRKVYASNEIPTDIFQIISYEYNSDVLVLESCGSLDIDAIVYYKFTKPNIKITGEYDPD